MVSLRVSEKIDSSDDPGIHRPTTVAATTPTAPIRDASTTCPRRILYMYRPTKKAIGMVQAMVNVPQDDPGTTCLHLAGSVTTPSTGISGVSAGTRTTNCSERSF